MEILKNVLLVLHFIGLAAIIGSFLVQTRSSTKRIDPAMWHGALTQLVTGLALVGVNEAMDRDLNHMVVGIKTLVLVAILALVLRGRKQQSVATGIWGAVGGLTILNVVLAVFG